ncbi:MAG: ABC transporter ATP-binding protein [Firmicutes bacterium]|nr:ABC transporter ATP-binding protein [Candidatus Fermentithermobacillaceae bacterium]
MLPGSVKRMFGCLKEHRWLIFSGVLMFVVALVGSNVGLALALRLMVDAVDESSGDLLNRFWLLYGALAVMVPPLMALSVLCTGIGIQRVLRDLRTALFLKSMTLSQAYHGKRGPSFLVSALINDTSLLGQTLTQNIPALCSSVVGVAVALGIVTRWNPVTIALVIPFVFLVSMVGRRCAALLKDATSSQQQAVSEVMEATSSVIAAHAVVRTLRAEKAWLIRYDEVLSRALLAVKRRGKIRAEIAATRWSSGLFHRFLELISALFVLRGQLTPGMAEAIAQMGSQVVSPVTQLGATWAEIQGGAAASDRIQEILDEPGESDEREKARGETGSGTTTRTGVWLEVRGLSYSYPGASCPAVRDCSFQVPSGHVVALVGPSGSGKSTLMHILLGLLQGCQGSFTWSAKDDQGAVGAVRLSYCPQDLELFRRLSVRDNLEMVLLREAIVQCSGRCEAKNDGLRPWYEGYGERVAAVIEAFKLNDMVTELKNGWDTLVDELSGGQKQRVALARAFVVSSQAVLLDEPTSHLDISNEDVVYEAIRRIKGGATVLMATHRVLHLDWVDRILVMNEGCIVEEGTFAELLKTDGLFASLYRSQRSRIGYGS